MAYTNTRYKKVPITPINAITEVPTVEAIDAIQPEQAIKPIYGYNSVDAQRQTYNRVRQQSKTFLSNYNDPTELNSYIDALVNTEAVSKTFGKAWGTISTTAGMVSATSWIGAVLAELVGLIAAPFTGGASLAAAQAVAAPLAKVGAIAAIPAAPAATKVLIDKNIKPILAGKPKEALLNGLMNFGETADIFANPIKGLVHEGGEGFVKSVGYLTEEGRTNYDYDTGFFLTDMLLEVVSDPLNWVDWGASAVSKTAAKQTVKPVAKDVTSRLVNVLNSNFSAQLGEKATTKNKTLLKKITRSCTDTVEQYAKLDPKKLSKEALAQATTNVRENLIKSVTTILRTEFPELAPKQIDTVLQCTTRSLKTGRFEKSITHTIQELALDEMSIAVIRGASNVTNMSKQAQHFFNKAALVSTGYGEVMDILKKRVGRPIVEWAVKQGIARLKAPKLYLQNTGINLKKYEEAKNAWINMGQYMSAIIGEDVTMDVHSFQKHLTDQFSRDQQLIDTILDQHKLKPIEQIAALDAQFKTLYGTDFDGYINLLSNVNTLEHNQFSAYLNRLISLSQTLPRQSFLQRTGAKLKTGAQLLGATNVVDYTKKTIQNLEALTKVLQANNTVNFNEPIYALKLNNARVNQLLLEDPILSQTFSELAGSSKLGALLDKLISDENAVQGTIKAQYPLAARTVKDAALTYQNMRRLYDNAAAVVLPEIEGIDNDKLRTYFIDIIFGMDYETIPELLANFETSTMPNAMGKLNNLFLYDKQLSDIDLGTIQTQFSQLFKTFLEEQQAVGAERINAAIVHNFTSAANDLMQGFSNLTEEFADLRLAVNTIYTRLDQVQMTNVESVSKFIGNKSTIFDVADTRSLSEAGLALKAIDLDSIKKVFAVSQDNLPAPLVLRMEQLGKSIVHLRKAFAQYDIYFQDTDVLEQVYKAFRTQFIDNPSGVVPETAFRYLRNATDPIDRFTQLAEFCKAIGDDKQIAMLFKGVFPLNTTAGAELYRNIYNPKALLKTDFAFDAMAQATWIAEAQLNEALLNGVNMYHNLGLESIKICNDFKKAREVLTSSATDRAQYVWQERYIKAVDKVNNALTFLKNYYDNLFDRELANTKIQALYDTLLKHPRFAEYRGVIQELEDYWAGIKSFRQDKKYYLKEGTLPDGTPAIDEFSPFWQRIKRMNKTYVDIQRSEIAKENIGAYFTDRALYTEYFKQAPEQGEALLDILNNASRELSQEDIAIYGRFILQLDYDKLPKELRTKTVYHGNQTDIAFTDVPWEFIPASIKELDFKYYYEILGIDDPRLVHNFLERVGLAGWHTETKNNIVGVLTNVYDFNHLKKVYLHESGHNILERLFGVYTPEYKAYLEQFKQKFIQHFGQDTFDKFYTAITYRYGKYHNYGIQKQAWQVPELLTEEQQNLILEEVFTFSLATELDFFNKEFDEMRKIVGDITLPDNLKELNKTFSQDITEELAVLAKQKNLHNTDFNDFYKKNTHLRFTDKYDIVTPWDPVKKQQELNRKIKQATDANAKGALAHFLQLTPEEITEELAFRKRFVTFHYNDLSDPRLAKYFKTLKQQATPINSEHYVYKNQFHIIWDAAHSRHWIVLDPSQIVQVDGRTVTLNTKKLVRKANPKRFDELKIVDAAIKDTKNPGLTAIANELDDTLYELTGTRLGDSQGENFTKEMYEKIFHTSQDGVPVNCPQQVWDLLPKDAEGNLLYDSFAGKDMYHFNESVMGSAASKAQLGMYGNNLIQNMSHAITRAQAYLKPKKEYVNLAFNSFLSINSPNSIWKEFSDEDLLQALQTTPDYHLVVLVDDKKYGIKTKKIMPINVDAIKKARELGGVILPTQVYKDMYNIVNHRLGSTGLAKIWSRIMYAYKTGYLLRPGAWIRNFIDTNIKSKLTMGSEMSTYNKLSHLILNDVHRIKDFIQARNADGIITQEAIEQFFGRVEGFTNLSKFLTYEEFVALQRDFFSQKVAGNIMSDVFTPEGSALWDAYTHITGKVIDTFNSTEEYNRLAVYLYNLDKGNDYTSALYNLSKTHFDYGFKTKAEQLVEMVFPFTTFSLRNYSYWAEMLEKHPWIMRNYAHLMKPHWDFKDYTPEELARDRRVQSQILYGQLKLGEFNDKVITFKANPSIQDAIQMFSDPINNVYDKLATPIAEPMKLLKDQTPNLNNAIPLAGPAIQAGQQIAKTGTPLPSAIGVQPIPRRKGKATANGKWSNPNLSGTDKYTDNTYRTPKYRKNVVYDSYAVKGVKRYRLNLYPIIDIAHDIKMRYSINVYNRIKNRVQTDVFKGIRYQLRLDVNRFR